MKSSKDLLEKIIREVLEEKFSKKIEVELVQNRITLENNNFIKAAHIFISEDMAKILGYEDGEVVNIKLLSDKNIYKNVQIIVDKKNNKKTFYLDAEIAKTLNLKSGDFVEIIKKNLNSEENKIGNKINSGKEISYTFEKDGIYTKLV